MTKRDKPQPLFEVPTIRLSADETRLILRIAHSDKPVETYTTYGLDGLGIVRRITLKNEATQKQLDDAWKAVGEAYTKRSEPLLRNSAFRLQQLTSKKARYGYVLTELGKQLARGLSIRLSASR